MSTTPEMRDRLQSLRIPREQRPASASTPTGYVGHRRRRRIWPLLLVLVAAGAGTYGYLKRDKVVALVEKTKESVTSEPQVTVRVIKVSARTDNTPPPVHTATGKIVSDHRVQVSTKVSGQITSLHFEQGDRVRKGQVLAKIEDVIYRARRDEATGRLAKARAALEYADFNFKRIKKLYDSQSAPESEYINAVRAQREAASQLAVEQATLDWTQKMLNDCEVVAPIEGVVLERNVEVGDFVAAEGGRGAIANAQFAVIADMTALRVEVDVSEMDIARLRDEMPCLITPDAYKNRKYHGQVMWIDPGANYSKATVQVKVRIQDPDDHLRVEGSAQVTFLSEAPTSAPTSAPAVIWIPNTAVRVDADGRTGQVYRVVDGRLRATPVRIGRQVNSQFEILSGLSDGDPIAAENNGKLTEGMKAGS